MSKSNVHKKILEKIMDSGNCLNLLFMKKLEMKANVHLKLGITITMENIILHDFFT